MPAPLVALHDCETNGLLRPSKTKTLMSRMHSLGIVFSDGRIMCCADSKPGYGGQVRDMELPSGVVLKDVLHTTIAHGLTELYKADIRVGHNSVDFDDRVYRRFHPHLYPKPGSVSRDTLILSRLLFPTISRDGPNTHKCPPGRLRMAHSLEAWGYRLNEHKDTAFDPGDWQTWTPEMSTYMMQDVLSLQKLWRYLISRKPAPEAVRIEHEFAALMRRQEIWGFTFDHEAALDLQADLQQRLQKLEVELVDAYGSWWQASPVKAIRATRKVKLVGYQDVVLPRFNAKGKRLPTDYVGPPRCIYEEGAIYTPVEYIEFSPGSRDHVRLMLERRHGWKPTKWTEKGAPQVDDDVLRGLPYPEAPKLADYYGASKILGYVATGKGAWLDAAYQEGAEWRMHGSVNTIGTYTFRPSFYDPNMGQVPTRDPTFGHRCRELFIARRLFKLMGWDGSSLQLRLLAHYLVKFDGGAYAKIVADGTPHEFMRDTVGADLMGEGALGRAKGKTMNYTIVFGGGDLAVGRVVEPHSSDKRKRELGREIKSRAANLFGPLGALTESLKDYVSKHHSLPGLDGRIAHVSKPHTALATLLQMAEKVVMAEGLIVFDAKLQAAGMIPGVDDAGIAHPELADYEFCAHVYDEAQLDVLPKWEETYRVAALEALPEAGRRLGVKCPLKAEAAVGHTWLDTH